MPWGSFTATDTGQVRSGWGHATPPDRSFVYVCSRRDLKDLYFTALDCFSGAELQRQSDCLQQMLASNLASSSRVASTQSQPSCSKNRRRTLRKQLEKIRLRMQQMSNEHGGGLGQGHVHREEKNPNDRVGSGFWRS